MGLTFFYFLSLKKATFHGTHLFCFVLFLLEMKITFPWDSPIHIFMERDCSESISLSFSLQHDLSPGISATDTGSSSSCSRTYAVRPYIQPTCCMSICFPCWIVLLSFLWQRIRSHCRINTFKPSYSRLQQMSRHWQHIQLWFFLCHGAHPPFRMKIVFPKSTLLLSPRKTYHHVLVKYKNFFSFGSFFLILFCIPFPWFYLTTSLVQCQ